MAPAKHRMRGGPWRHGLPTHPLPLTIPSTPWSGRPRTGALGGKARVSWTGRKPLPTAVLPRPKTGSRRRQNQAGQRHEVGGGRRRRYAFGKPPGRGDPSRSNVGRSDPRDHCGTTAGRDRPRQRPARLIYDKACDSDALRQRLAKRGIDRICPHRRNPKKVPLQDGCTLRRYKRRWKVERTFAWLGNFRRLVVRWEHSITLCRAFVMWRAY
jgi:transposase